MQEWRTGTSQEIFAGSPAGYFTDPQFSEPGNGGTISDPRKLHTLSYPALPPRG